MEEKKERGFPSGVYDVIPLELLEGSTRQGWHFVQFVEDEELVPGEVTHARDSFGNIDYSQPANVGQRDKLRRVRCLVHQDEASELARLNLAVAAQTQKAVDAEGARQVASDRVRELMEEKDVLERNGARLAEKTIAAERSRDEHRRQLKAMEKDMALVRQAVGDLRWKEILGAQRDDSDE